MAAPVTAEQEYYGLLGDHHLTALWQRSAETGAPTPRTTAVPWRWRRDEYWPLLLQAAEVVTPGHGAERRVVQFQNPGLRGAFGATHTLVAAMQLLMPGEVAPPHRHTPAAIRFVVAGDGAYTTVDGEQCMMHRYDLILTPSWTWHDHGNESGQPMIWLDGLDAPMVRMLDGAFFEPYEGPQQPVTRPDGTSQKEFPTGGLVPAWPVRRHAVAPLSLDVEQGTATPRSHSPRCIYPWSAARQALDDLAHEAATPWDDVILAYAHPLTGGPVTATLGCHIQLLRPGVKTQAHQHTGSVAYYVVEGSGSSQIGDERFDWAAGDVVVVPSWAPHAHANTSSTAPAILFSITDAPTMVALDLYRERAVEA